MNLLTFSDDCLSLILGRLDVVSRFLLLFVGQKLSKTKDVNKEIVRKTAIRLGELPLLQFLQVLKFNFAVEDLKYFVSDNLETLKWLVKSFESNVKCSKIAFRGITFESSVVCDKYLMGLRGYDKLLPETKMLLFEKYDDWVKEDDIKRELNAGAIDLRVLAKYCAIKTLRVYKLMYLSIRNQGSLTYNCFIKIMSYCGQFTERSIPFLDYCFEISKGFDTKDGIEILIYNAFHNIDLKKFEYLQQRRLLLSSKEVANAYYRHG